MLCPFVLTHYPDVKAAQLFLEMLWKDHILHIACLHTAESNIAVFEAAATALGIPEGTLHHKVRPELLADAERAGGLTAEIAAETLSALTALARNTDADAVILNCSTLGPALDGITEIASVPVSRVDAALAEQATRAGGKVVVLCAVETTVASTQRLFSKSATQHGATVEVQLVPGAWALFRAGDQEGYLAAIAGAADAAYGEGATIVALAQASMTQAARLVTQGPAPLSSPAAGLSAAHEQVSRRI